MPNDNEIRLDVSSVKAFHEHIVAELQLMLGPDVAVDEMIVKPRQFQNVLQFDIVQEATEWCLACDSRHRVASAIPAC